MLILAQVLQISLFFAGYVRENVIVEPDGVHLGKGVVLLRLTEDGVRQVDQAVLDSLEWLATHRARLVGEENKDVGVLLLWLGLLMLVKLIEGLAVEVDLELAVGLAARSGLVPVFHPDIRRLFRH